MPYFSSTNDVVHPEAPLMMPTCGTPMLFFLLLVFKITKKVAAAITTSATAYSAISLLYLHIINIPVHVICRATTDDNGPQRTTSSVVTQRLTYDVVRCVNGPLRGRTWTATGWSLERTLAKRWHCCWRVKTEKTERLRSRTWATFRTFTLELRRVVWEKFHFSVVKMCLFMYVWQHELTMSDAKMCLIYLHFVTHLIEAQC